MQLTGRINKSYEFIQLLIFTIIIVGLVYYGDAIQDPLYYKYYHYTLLMIAIAITFISPERGLYIFIIVSMFSPELSMGQVSRRKAVLRFDDVMVVIGVLAWFIIRIIRKEIKFLNTTPLDKPILFFILVCALSTSRGVLIRQVDNPKAGFFYVLKLLEFFFVYYLVVNSITTKTQLRKCITIFIITLLFTMLTGFDQLSAGVHRVSTPFEGTPEPNTMGGYLLFMFSIVSALAIMNAKIFFKYFVVLIIPPLIWIFLHTLSRGSYLGYFPVLITLCLLLPKGKKIYGLIILILSLTLIQFLPTYITTRIDNTFIGRDKFRIPTLTGEETEVTLDPSSASRITKFKNVLNYWAEYPIFGLGITGAGFIDSTLFRTIGELGLMGLFALIWLISSILSETINSFRFSRNGLNKGLCIGYICGLIGLIVHGLTANTFFLIRIMGPFWFITGLIIMIPQIYFDELAKPAGYKFIKN